MSTQIHGNLAVWAGPPGERGRVRELIVMSKEPAAGRSKTRVAHALSVRCGAGQALTLSEELAWALLADSVEVCAAAAAEAGALLRVCHSPSAPGARFCELLRSLAPGVDLEPQCEGELGDRLAHAMRRGVARVVVGMDTPDIPLTAFAAAFRASSEGRVALGPAHDGGYYLLALPAELPGASLSNPGIRWSAPTTAEDTLGALGPWPVTRLPELVDVDRPEDLARFRLPGPGAARTRAWVKERWAWL